MKKIINNIIALVLFFSCTFGYSQNTVIHDIPWQSDTVGMWGSGSTAWSINQIDTLVDFTIGPYNNLYSYVTNLPWPISDSVGVIFDYGAYIDLQMVFEMVGWSGGAAKVNYPTKIQMDFPANGTFSNGNWVTIPSEYREQDTTVHPADQDKWNIYAKWPDAGKIELFVNLDMQANMDLIYSDVTDSLNITWDTMHVIQPINLNLDTFDIFLIDLVHNKYVIPWVAYHTDPLTGNTVIDSVYFIRDSIGWPLQFPPIFYNLIGITGSISIPQISNYKTWIENEQRLYAWGKDPYLNINLDLVKFIQVMCHYLSNIPSMQGLASVSQALTYIRGDTSIYIFTDPLSGEDFTVNLKWDLLDMNLLFSNTMNQTLSFEENKEYSIFGIPIPPKHYPNVWNVFNFPVPVDYEVLDTTGTVIESGNSDSIKFGSDYDLRLRMPCYNYDSLPVTITHTIDPWLTNMVRDSIDVSFYIKVLDIDFSAGTPSDTLYSFHYILYQDTLHLGTFAGPPLFGPPIFMPWLIKGDFDDTTFVPDQYLVLSNHPLDDTISFVNVQCFGTNSGSAAVIASGGAPPYTYQWSDGSSIISNNAALTNLNVGTYFVTVTDANGCMVIDSVTLINMNPHINISHTSVDVLCHGNNTGSALVNVSGGTPAYQYTWSPNVGTSPNISNLYAGNYYVTVQDAAGCKAFDTIYVNEPDSALLIQLVNASNLLCYGANNGSIDISVAGGTTPYLYQWSNGSTAQDLNNLGAGNYIITVTDNHHCKAYDTITISRPTSPLQISLTNLVNVSCNNGSNGSINISVTGGTNPYSYQWTNGSTTQNLNNLGAGNYIVTVTDKNNCDAYDTIVVTQPAAPLQITLSNLANVSCFNGNNGSIYISVAGGTNPFSYHWSNGSTAQNLNNLVAGNYIVTVTDKNNCNAYDTIVVTEPSSALQIALMNVTNVSCNNGSDGSIDISVSGGSSPYFYQWSNGNTSQDQTNLNAGIFIITVRDANNCSVNDTIKVTQPDPIIVYTHNYRICLGQSIAIGIDSITGGTPPYSYTWNTGATTSSIMISPTVTTNYTLNILDAKGCPGSLTNINVSVTQALSIHLTAVDDSICSGNSTQIFANIIGGGGPPYQITWNTGQSGTPLTVSPSATTTYIATVWDTCHFASVNDSIVIYVIPLPAVYFAALPVSGCQPLTVQFNDLSADPNCTISWDFGDGSGGSNIQNPSHIYNQSGNYAVTLDVTSQYGCKNSLTMNNMIDVWTKPSAAFTSHPSTTSVIDPQVSFTNLSSTTYQSYWDFGDGLTSVATDPDHFYQTVDTFNVMLIITSADGCLDTAWGQIHVKDILTFYIPNAFTPDGNGVNDVFMPKGNLIDPDHYEMVIFDRWGEMIFDTKDLNKGWDGTMNGSPILGDAVFDYMIRFKDRNGLSQEKVGKITLLHTTDY